MFQKRRRADHDVQITNLLDEDQVMGVHAPDPGEESTILDVGKAPETRYLEVLYVGAKIRGVEVGDLALMATEMSGSFTGLYHQDRPVMRVRADNIYAIWQGGKGDE